MSEDLHVFLVAPTRTRRSDLRSACAARLYRRTMPRGRPPTFYTLNVSSSFVLYVRTGLHPAGIEQPVRRALAALDPALPVLEIHTMAEEVDASAAPEHLSAGLASVFGLLAALLAAFGIYGLLA